MHDLRLLSRRDASNFEVTLADRPLLHSEPSGQRSRLPVLFRSSISQACTVIRLRSRAIMTWGAHQDSHTLDLKVDRDVVEGPTSDHLPVVSILDAPLTLHRKPGTRMPADRTGGPLNGYSVSSAIARRRSWSSWLLLGIASSLLTYVLLLPHSAPQIWSRSLDAAFDLSARYYSALADVNTVGDVDLEPPRELFSSNGRTDQVQWDNYSLVLQGQRILI